MTSAIKSFSIKAWHIQFHAFSTQEREHHDSQVGASVGDSRGDAKLSSAGFANTCTSVRETVVHHHHHQQQQQQQQGILLVSVPLSSIFQGEPLQCFDASDEMGRGVRVALADYAARCLGRLLPLTFNSGGRSDDQDSNSCGSLQIKTMGQARHSNNTINVKTSRRSQRRKMPGKKQVEIPYVLERTDCLVAQVKKEDDEAAGKSSNESVLQFYLHADFSSYPLESMMEQNLSQVLEPMLSQLMSSLTTTKCFQHIATVVLQRQLRAMLQPPRNNVNNTSCATTTADDSTTEDKYLNAVAFIADNSILPRKSGRSNEPMSSPPAVPFASPHSDMLTRVVEVEIGCYWRRYLNEDGSVNKDDSTVDCNDDFNSQSMQSFDKNNISNTDNKSTTSTVTIRGMIIPLGVTLIVGGGYHGKSTLLTALSMGIYDKIPNDGRERCVTHADALSIRAEDGRYVNNVNVSAFISNLPTGGDTRRFSTRDASGSTSQAANVVEGLECGGSAFLVDEDVSAANFMARDGRMRAMIMDEPITPLLYRVNGLYLSKEHNISTVVVVGGVGEWLDVADAVVLMKDYVAYDGLEKARSVSYQFSYNHVQYAGRGVVHRLPWEVKEEKRPNATIDENEDGKETATLSPLRRKPDADCMMKKFRNVAVHLLDSGASRLWFYPDDDNSNSFGCNDDDDGIVDMSKCSQLLGNACEQLYGCGICILWLMRESTNHPDDDINDLLKRLEVALDGSGMIGLLASLSKGAVAYSSKLSNMLLSNVAHDLWEDSGFAYRPRVHEVAMTLTRMRGLTFDILPQKHKEADVVSEEDEQKTKMDALAKMWNNRRKR